MANFNGTDYENFCKEETNAVAVLKAKVAKLSEGDRVYFYNSTFRRNEWQTVQTVEKFDECTARITTTKNKTVWADSILIVVDSQAAETWSICLNDRQSEFNAALTRAADSQLEVFHDFERDVFIVVNKKSKAEYKVILKTIDGKVLVSCQCEDFNRRSRVCKHISTVLKDTLCDVLALVAKTDKSEAVV